MSGYCRDCDEYRCRCPSMSLDDILQDMDCRISKLEKIVCSSKKAELEIITSVEMPFEVEGTVDVALFTVSGDIGYTVYAYQPKLTGLNPCNNPCNPYDIIYNSWGEPTVNNGGNTNGCIYIPSSIPPTVSNVPLVRSLNGVTEIILENVTITRPVIGPDPITPVDVIIGRVPPIARPVDNRTVVLYDRAAGTNPLGFPNDTATNSIGNIIDRITLTVATTGRIILRITFRSPQVPPLHSSYTSTNNVSIRYNISQHSPVMI